jgi:hypothetical protein
MVIILTFNHVLTYLNLLSQIVADSNLLLHRIRCPLFVHCRSSKIQPQNLLQETCSQAAAIGNAENLKSKLNISFN